MKKIEFTKEFFNNLEFNKPYRFGDRQFGIYKANDKTITVVSYSKIVAYINIINNIFYIDVMRCKGYTITNKQITQFIHAIYNIRDIQVYVDTYKNDTYIISALYSFTK